MGYLGGNIMQDTIYFSIYVLAMLTTSMMAGIYFIFSNTIMISLEQIDQRQGAEAMQWINRFILNPGFFSLFFGSALFCAVILFRELFVTHFQAPYAGLAALLLLIAFIITASCNVPLNNALDKADITQQQGLETWQHYLKHWVIWNHLRTITSSIAALLFALQFVLLLR